MHTEVVRAVAAGDAASGPLPLTWAQRNMWNAIWGYGTDVSDLTLLRSIVPTHELSMTDALDAVAQVVSWYEVARTTFDRERLRQRVTPDVELPVAVREVSDDPRADAVHLLEGLRGTPFVHEDEPPVRVGLVSDGSRVASIGLAMSHLAFDMSGVDLLRDAFAAELTADRRATPVSGRQTSWLVTLEASEALARLSTATIAKWSAAMAKLPSGCGIVPPTPGVYTVTGLRSTALAVAAQVIAVRTRTGSGSVIIAALCTALREIMSQAPAALRIIAGNRQHRDLADFAGIALQNGLFVLPDVAGRPDFDEFVRGSHRAAIWGYVNARYDTGRLLEVVSRDQERGLAPDLSYFFNDLRSRGRDWSGLDARYAELPRLAREELAEPTRLGGHSVRDCTLFLHVLPVSTECSLRLMCNDSVLEPATAGTILRRLREIVIDAALGGSGATSNTAPADGSSRPI
ncbi:hypothetical protein I0C86_09570 [Plantactinospora sp. S1510]|uniref:Condensation domain-containing protein n=1 Tax=Plantactinospora alkalitolerans TaxID=2789879 RepID=A0ABS0GTI8_9ACTN|nr:hypothetical protein [Plantactinospora alkalitolerans]MBF9129222.1 hypothetical protein [Plantactinospora alkalitolerans]